MSYIFSEIVIPVILDIFFVHCGLESGTREKMAKKTKSYASHEGELFLLVAGQFGPKWQQAG